MMILSKKHPRKLKFLLFSIVICTLGAVLGIFIGYRLISNHPEKLLMAMQGEGDISISKIHHTATRNGKTEWILEAESANVASLKKLAVLKEVTISFFLKDMTEARLSANHGILNYQTNDIEVNGNVVVTRGKHSLRTERLFYNHLKQWFISDVPVEISGQSIRLAADSMTYDLTKNRTHFKGNVRTTFNEKNIL